MNAPASTHTAVLVVDPSSVDLDEDQAAARRLLEEIGRWQPGAVRLTCTRTGASVRGFPLLRKPFGVEDLLRYAA